MKKLRKLLSALLALAMLMSMVLPVSAEGIAVRVPNFDLLEAAPAEEVTETVPEAEAEETAPVTVVTEEITVEAEVTNADQPAETITVGETKQVIAAPNEVVVYQFTAPESGYYILYAEQGISYGSNQWDVADSCTANVGWWNDINGMYSGPVMKAEAGKLYEIYIENVEYDYDMHCTLTLVKAQNFQTLEFEQNKVSGAPDGMAYLCVKPQGGYCFEEISWASSDQNVAVVVQPYGTNAMIGFTGAGTATITATSESGLTATCTVTVKEVEQIVLDQPFAVSMNGGDQALYSFTPAEDGTYILHAYQAGYIGPNVYDANHNWVDYNSWSSENEEGYAFELTGGETYTIKLNNWRDDTIATTFTMTKGVNFDYIEMFQSNVTAYLGAGFDLAFSNGPKFGSEPAVWTIADENILTLDYSHSNWAWFIPKALGTTTVTATAVNSGLSTTCTVTVTEMETITGSSVDVTVDANSQQTYVFTPAEDGNYLFYLPSDIWGIGFEIREQESDNWIDGGDWEHSDSGYHGAVFELSQDVTYLVTVNNWQSYQQTFTVSLTKTVPYDTFRIEGSSTCYLDNGVYLRIYGEPMFAAEVVEWTLSNPAVVSVEYSGTSGINLRGVATGTTTVTATTASGMTATFELTVKEMETLGMGTTEVEVPAGSRTQVGFTAPESGTYIIYRAMNTNYGLYISNMQSSEWYSDDDSYYGQAVELTAGGTAFVNVQNWQNYDQTCTITVTKAVPYEYITFKNAPMGFVGEQAYVQLTGGPGFAYSPVQWTSSDPAVASIQWENGTNVNVMCHAVGTTTITATTSNDLSISYEMKVSEVPTIEADQTLMLEIPYDSCAKVSFTPTQSGTYIFHYPYDDYFGIECYDPNGNWINGTSWMSGDDASYGRTYTLSAGVTYTLAVYNWYVQGTAQLALTVTKAVPYTKLAFTQDSYTTYLLDNFPMTVNVGYEPEFGGEEVVVTSSNTDVVDSGWFNGDCVYLNAVATGTATITISTVDGRLSDTCTVTVKDPVTITSGKQVSITLDPNNGIIYQFTPTASGTYSFYCLDAKDCSIGVYDVQSNYIGIGRWAGEDLVEDFEVTAGETYYIWFGNYGEAKATFKVGLTQPSKATSMTLITQDFNLYPDWSFWLVPFFGPTAAKAEKVTWTSTNEKVAQFVEAYEYGNGTYEYYFYAEEAGTATLTATSESGLKATIKITVTEPAAIGLGTKSVSVRDWDTVMYEFTAPEAGTYVIYDEDPDSRVGWYADSSNTSMQAYEDGEKRGIKIMLAEGEVAWPAVSNNTDETKTFTFTIEQGAHEHEIKLVEAKDATYAQPGNIAHYACDCGVLFADAEGTTEITMDSIRIPMLIQIEDGKAEVPKEVIDEFVAEVEQGGEVSIPVAEAGTNADAEVESAALPVQSLSQIAEKEASLTVEMPAATVTMDTAALAAVVEKTGGTGEVTLEVKEVAEEDLTESQMAAIEAMEKKPDFTISAELLVGGQSIASKDDGGFADGKVTVKIPVGTGKAEYSVLYIADDGTVEEIPAVLQDGCLVIELSHFSDYAIIKHTLLGDVNGDGKVTIADLMRLANFFAGKAQLG